LAINKRLDAIVAGISAGLRQDSVYVSTGVALSGTAEQTNTLPASGTFPIAYSTGWVRIKIYNGGGTNPTLTSLKILAGDGTNSVLLYALNPATAHNLTATSWFDECIDFLVDVAATGAGGGATGQLIAANGINTITIKTTLGGTTPTATLDAECLMAI
jgi:hypothetical protein